MGKFGKKVEVSEDMNRYTIGMLGPSGFGKTTLMYQVCEKCFGSKGYIILDCGQEDGVATLQGAVAERTPSWKKYIEVVEDITTNKGDYPDLKVVVIDTLDALFESCEAYTVARWNYEGKRSGNDKFVAATSINGVEGGFGKGMDRVIKLVKDSFAALQEVGVGVWYCAHVKEKETNDLMSGVTYTTLTANMPAKYFNAIKNISHIIGFGYLARVIQKRELEESENAMTKKKKERKEIKQETRKIKFRDDLSVADSKSRFREVAEEINLDAEEFIKAVKDAIKAAKEHPVTVNTRISDSSSAKTKATKASAQKQEIEEKELEEAFSAEETADNAEPFVEEDEIQEDEFVTPKVLMDGIIEMYPSASREVKVTVKGKLEPYGGKLSADVPFEVLKEIFALVEKDVASLNV